MKQKPTDEWNLSLHSSWVRTQPTGWEKSLANCTSGRALRHRKDKELKYTHQTTKYTNGCRAYQGKQTASAQCSAWLAIWNTSQHYVTTLFHPSQNGFGKDSKQDWRNGSALRELTLNQVWFQHPHGGSQPCTPPIAGDLTSSSALEYCTDLCVVHRHACKTLKHRK